MYDDHETTPKKQKSVDKKKLSKVDKGGKLDKNQKTLLSMLKK